jgi:hypothetical protein
MAELRAGCPEFGKVMAGRIRRLAAGAARRVKGRRGAGGFWRAGGPPVFCAAGRRQTRQEAGKVRQGCRGPGRTPGLAVAGATAAWAMDGRRGVWGGA